jgi:hypothetical protein
MGKYKEGTGAMKKFLNVYIVGKEQHLALIPAPALLTHLIHQAHQTHQAHKIPQVHNMTVH